MTISQDIIFDKHYITPPKVFVNLSSISIEQPNLDIKQNSKYNRRIVYNISATEITEKDFKINVETWHYNQIYYFKVD